MPPQSQQSITVSSLTYLTPAQLRTAIIDPTLSPKVAVIDVRDSDYIGGHIKSSIHAPTNQLDVHMPELLRTLRDKDRVVFHCMLSQQRGPFSALAYARARAGMMEKERKAEAGAGVEGDKRNDGDDNGDDDDDGEAVVQVNKNGKIVIAGQEVCILQGGFTDWQKSFGTDKELTEGYIKELWDAELFS